jgi:hypothetical protein
MCSPVTSDLTRGEGKREFLSSFRKKKAYESFTIGDSSNGLIVLIACARMVRVKEALARGSRSMSAWDRRREGELSTSD